jgi:hypothetical protein
MEFNSDGSLKVGESNKEIKNRATISISDLPKPKKGVVLVVEILDSSVPYNLIEGQFHNINVKYSIDCDAHLGKKSETLFEIMVTGEAYKEWVDKFCFEIKDYLDGKLEIN